MNSVYGNSFSDFLIRSCHFSLIIVLIVGHIVIIIAFLKFPISQFTVTVKSSHDTGRLAIPSTNLQQTNSIYSRMCVEHYRRWEATSVS
jgi:hypothetical protein